MMQGVILEGNHVMRRRSRECTIQRAWQQKWWRKTFRIQDTDGLRPDLAPDGLDFGTRRRLTVACQLICCSSLVILEDVLLGIQEGDALAIMRAVHDLSKYPPPPSFTIPTSRHFSNSGHFC